MRDINRAELLQSINDCQFVMVSCQGHVRTEVKKSVAVGLPLLVLLLSCVG